MKRREIEELRRQELLIEKLCIEIQVRSRADQTGRRVARQLSAAPFF